MAIHLYYWSALCLVAVLALTVEAEPVIVALSNTTTVQNGGGALLLCIGFSSTGADLTITWMKSGVNITNSSSSTIIEEDIVVGGRNFMQSYIQLCQLQYFDGGNYTCSVSNGTHSVEAPVQVDVGGFAEVVVLSNNTQGETGGSALLVCTGHSLPHNSSTVSWIKDSQELSNSSTVTITEEIIVQNNRHLRTSYLIICGLQFSDSGNYICVVSNGEQENNATTTLSVPDDAVEIVAISNYTTARVGGSAILICVALTGPDAVAVVSSSWIKRGRTVANSSDVSITSDKFMQQGRSFYRSLLRLCNLTYGDTATYTCSVENGALVTVNSSVELFILSEISIGSTGIRETCTTGLGAREAILRDTLQLISQENRVDLLGVTRDYAAPSCNYIANTAPNKRSGLYWIAHENGSLVKQQCTL